MVLFWGENSLLLTYIEANKSVFSKLTEDTYDLLTVLSGIRAMKNIKKEVEIVGGNFDMCKAFDDMMKDSRMEGRLEGRSEGKREGENLMGKLNQKLISQGRIDDLLLASTDSTYRRKMMTEFGLV